MAVIRPITAQRGLDIGSIPSTNVDDSVGRGLQSLGGQLQQTANQQQENHKVKGLGVLTQKQTLVQIRVAAIAIANLKIALWATPLPMPLLKRKSKR